ncbi:MAG: biopolymer transporter ExbD [Elusimicrobiota bacterium]
MASYSLLRMRSSSPEPEPVTEVNIIPVIDISLVLLVILFVTAPLLAYPTLPVELPAAGTPPNQELTIAVTYLKNGSLSVRASPSSWEDLTSDLRREIDRKRGGIVLLRADAATPYRIIQRLILSAKSAGAPQIALATEPARR